MVVGVRFQFEQFKDYPANGLRLVGDRKVSSVRKCLISSWRFSGAEVEF